MKTFQYLLFAFPLFFFACDKDDDPTTSIPPDALVVDINDVLWEPSEIISNEVRSGQDFVIFITAQDSNGIGVGFSLPADIRSGEYNFIYPLSRIAPVYQYDSAHIYLHEIDVKVTEHNKTEKRISGEFSFPEFYVYADKVIIDNGRFDVTYLTPPQ